MSENQLLRFESKSSDSSYKTATFILGKQKYMSYVGRTEHVHNAQQNGAGVHTHRNVSEITSEKMQKNIYNMQMHAWRETGMQLGQDLSVLVVCVCVFWGNLSHEHKLSFEQITSVDNMHPIPYFTVCVYILDFNCSRIIWRKRMCSYAPLNTFNALWWISLNCGGSELCTFQCKCDITYLIQ